MSKRKACEISVHIPENDADAIFDFFQGKAPTREEFTEALYPDLAKYKNKVLVNFEYSGEADGVGFDKAEIVTPFQWFVVKQQGDFKTTIGSEGQGCEIYKELTYEDCFWSTVDDPLKIRGALKKFEETDELSQYYEDLSDETKLDLAVKYLEDSCLDERIVRIVLQSLIEVGQDTVFLEAIEAFADI